MSFERFLKNEAEFAHNFTHLQSQKWENSSQSLKKFKVEKTSELSTLAFFASKEINGWQNWHF